MSILFLVTQDESKAILQGFVDACDRRGEAFECFFTGAGVKMLNDIGLLGSIENASRAVVCEHSWQRLFPGQNSPVELGSQTDHSAMQGNAGQVVSL